MKILYDHQTFTLQNYGGISRYFFELIRYFNKSKDTDIDVSLLFSNNHYISDKRDINHIQFLPNNEFRGKQRLMLLINKIISIIRIKKQHFDLFHPTYYDPYFLKYIDQKPFVLTVYDMTHEKFSEMFLSNDPTTQNKRTLCEKASKIISISQSTKNDLIELFGIEESKIEVIYLGNSMVLDNTVDLDNTVPKKYILFVGSRSSYKNFDTFIKSASLLLREHSDLSLVCVGGGKFSNQEISLFEKLNIKNKVFQYNLKDKLLAQFYAKALMFVFPSLYEGFGIPILEAFACRCPLLCSNTSSLPEIAGDGAEYFNPYSEESIYNAMKKILENDEQRESLIKNGTQRLKSFSWEQTAKQTKEVYEGVLK
ncbi:glycosyltransferase family 4 protein [bacterium]|nr:glycosyltransferase family 4 protein [bacterium]MBU1435295.1 glycosyltransferase family 4 protein [bacterium]MBU1503493.1 glycosyltransferase family 4 protein [bacterium]